jgi:dienelactone hydrolase
MNFTKKYLFPIFLLQFSYLNLAIGQDYPSWGNLKSGNFNVGFRTIQTYDSTRNYKPEQGIHYRPLLIHLWYPTEKTIDNERITFKTYIALETQREKFKEEKTAFIENYCKQQMYGYIDVGKGIMGGLNVSIDEVLASKTASIADAKLQKGKFPLIIYAPSFGKSSIQNNVVCEYLASYGYIIASVASAGENSQVMTSDEKGVISQVIDLEFLVNYLKTQEHLKFSKIGSLGYSWGGFSGIIHQMRNKYVNAVASWDGSHEYHGYEIAQNMKGFKPTKMTVPYLFFANKNEEWTQFPFFKSIPSHEKYLYRCPQFEHSEFTSYWTTFANARAYSTPYSLESYILLCEKTLLFFDNNLKRLKNRSKNTMNSESKFLIKLSVD